MVETEIDSTIPDIKGLEKNTDLSSLPLAVEDEKDKKGASEKREYKEIFVKSFSEAVDGILENVNPVLSPQMAGDKNFCLVDIDCALIEDNRVKLPIISNFVKPHIPEENIIALKKLTDRLEGSVAISTNRSPNDKIIFHTQAVLDELYSSLKSRNINVPVFLNLFKQIPTMNKEDVSRQYLSDSAKEMFDNENGKKGLREPLAEQVVQYIGKRLSEGDSRYSTGFTLYSIEDLSIASPNRYTYLKYLERKLKEEYDIDVNIVNYVIKR
ncbi:MAG TPA: hypothetical protein PLT51_03720 [Candidatus Dojkabacteria bacterium]|nr:hypothetical protein [Candidatus Dojkabacteria bacterium]